MIRELLLTLIVTSVFSTTKHNLASASPGERFQNEVEISDFTSVKTLTCKTKVVAVETLTSAR